MKTNSYLIPLANFVSVAGHPLITTSLFIVFVTFQQLPFNKAAIISSLMICGVILPITFQNYRKVKQGRFTNFDVSNRKQRTQFYYPLIGLLALVTGLLFATNQPRPFCYGVLFSLLLIVCAFLFNFFIKVSLHTAFSFFITWAISLINPVAGVGMVLFSLLIAFSRLILKRHTIPEVTLGALLGLLIGAGFYWLMT